MQWMSVGVGTFCGFYGSLRHLNIASQALSKCGSIDIFMWLFDILRWATSSHQSQGVNSEPLQRLFKPKRPSSNPYEKPMQRPASPVSPLLHS
ncbi:hypothetical protein AVEN_230927-1 [Araneus ventricosus]|uniref:Uncharacterized protein n=1 Tax=Araneus ventricosus TaxID=182803 RepID=A0A4Y2A2U3_ARAVE|nr:hypothetical protein AVEN_230927-1 [Araneus ventricosus]